MVSVDEKKTVAASYILSFYSEVQNLTHNHSQYVNLLLELENKTNSDAAKQTDADKQIIINACQMLRYSATKCYIQYKSIAPQLKTKAIDLDKLYLKIRNNFIFNRNDIEEYTIMLNNVLVEGIIQELLATSQKLVGDIFKNE